MAQVIQLPERAPRKGSITPQQVEDVHKAMDKVEAGQAVVVCTGMKSENAARNRARSLAKRYADQYKIELRSHAVKGENNQWIGAVSVKPAEQAA